MILPGGIEVEGAHWGLFVVLLIVGGLAGSAIGLVLGIIVSPNQINVVFAVALTPLIFTGATFYPWQALSSLRWFQVVTLFDPLTYVSEEDAGRADFCAAPARRLDRSRCCAVDRRFSRDRNARVPAPRRRLAHENADAPWIDEPGTPLPLK